MKDIVVRIITPTTWLKTFKLKGNTGTLSLPVSIVTFTKIILWSYSPNKLHLIYNSGKYFFPLLGLF